MPRFPWNSTGIASPRPPSSIAAKFPSRTTIIPIDSWVGTAESNGEMAGDLDALASVLRMAGERGVSFSLVLRLQARDNMQVVCTGEPRQGSFW